MPHCKALQRLKGLEAHIQLLELLEEKDVLNNLNLHAFVNESCKEHGFAIHEHKDQYRHTTLRKYAHSKGHHEVELIKKTCQSPHAYHTKTVFTSPGRIPDCLLWKLLQSTSNGANNFVLNSSQWPMNKQKRTSRWQECLMSRGKLDHPRTSGICISTNVGKTLLWSFRKIYSYKEV